ncbi:hypothetical protein MCHI_003654 [Candidatus Magnetoovum chiemensis]|nr:hypothetical protein MCHI_003654 [Candidatus Magnetoovum chiemensis]
MILYYAFGGGLGHISRAYAVINHLPMPVRILASSRLTHLTLDYAPCPVDILDLALLNKYSQYYSFLNNYIRAHNIKTIILDTFPFGIVGEWLETAKDIPRILIARYIKWEDYLKRVKHKITALSYYTLALEELELDYKETLKRSGTFVRIDAPVVIDENRYELSIEAQSPSNTAKGRAVVVHSGDEKEQKRLLDFAKTNLSGAPIDTVNPRSGIYPAEK